MGLNPVQNTRFIPRFGLGYNYLSKRYLIRMKSFPTKTHHLLITTALIGIIFLSALIFPGQTAARQGTPEPIPTSTPAAEDDLSPRSGDTEGLMWGAGIILVIIMSGVLIQRVIDRPDSDPIQ